MRVSEAYGLSLSQAELDFVNVDTHGDSPLFLDPRSLLLYKDEWGERCVSLLQEFFTEVLRLLAIGPQAPAAILGQLHEPNETRLGFSSGRAQGRAVGTELADRLGEALITSQAVETGLLQDLEDTILLIAGIGPDLISDITTCVIREPLIEYTQAMADEYGMELVTTHPGPIWDPTTKLWRVVRADVLKQDRRALLLVPKAIVRRKLDFDADEYFDDVIYPFLRDEEMAAGSSLVEVLQNGNPRVTRKAIIEKYGRGKRTNAAITLRAPHLIDDYRRMKATVPSPLSHDDLAYAEAGDTPDWNSLLAAVLETPAGAADADRYHMAVKGLVSAIFWPGLINGRKEVPLHEKRKRIDIVFTNAARGGFFFWLGLHQPAANVFVECKNYASDLGNPELDQLGGRFGPTRGMFGLLVCRSFDDKAEFIKRCRDTALDGRGFIIVLDDDDLRLLSDLAREKDEAGTMDFLKGRFDELTM
jgi:hypothetical protein